ncbi:hypothetical protein Q1695_009386 [Nippostrongylus brasiliensis]|nr:hypothetical protein Q1695_009386 [Nippostrongylus brasiliensis]
MANEVRIVIGLFVNIEMWTMLLLNIFVLACIITSRLYANKDNPVYVLSGFNIVCDICQLTLHVLYVGPSIIVGDWFFGSQEAVGVTVAATIFLGIWYLGSLVQILFATNRFVVIFFPNRIFFTRQRLIGMIIVCCLGAAAMVTYSQLLSPCCRITPDYRYFGYSYLIFPNQTSNPSMNYIDVPLDSITSAYCLGSYVALFAYIIRMGTLNNRAGKREVRCCVQFLLMFCTYTVTWVTFFVYPAIGITQPEAFVVTTVMFMLNCGINSTIYLAMNREIRSAANKLIGRNLFGGQQSNAEKSTKKVEPSTNITSRK